MGKWLSCMLEVAWREIRSIFTDDGVMVFFFIVPCLYPLLYAYLYSPEAVHEVPVVVVDECRSSLSREFLRKCDGTADLTIVSYCTDMEEAQEVIRRHKAYGLIQIPADFSDNLAEGRQAVVNAFCDMSGLLYYKAIYSACSHVSLEMNKHIQMEYMAGLTQHELDCTLKPIEYEYVTMYNSKSGYCTYIIPAVLVVVIQQTLVLGIAMLAGTENERRRKGITVLTKHYSNPMAVLAGKGLVYFLIYCMVSLYALFLIPRFFDMPQMWQFDDMLTFTLPLLLDCIFFALTLSYLIRDRESCFLLFVFASVPLMFASGITWPASNIPPFWKGLSYIFPSTFGINGFVKMTNMGATLYDVRSEYMMLWVQTAVYFMCSVLIYIRMYRSNLMPGSQYVRKKYRFSNKRPA